MTEPIVIQQKQFFYKATPVRWYILTVHCLVGISQTLIYTTWGSIATSAEESFGLSQLDFALLPNWFNIVYAFVIWPFMWMIQNVDLRSAEILTAALTALGAAVRCLNFGPGYESANRYIIHIGHAINAAGTPIPWMGCPYLSALWFPQEQRAIATSIGVMASAGGAALSAVVSPIYVHAMTRSENPTVEELNHAIRSLLYLESVVCQITLVVVIIYFPARPKYLPSYTAGQARTPFLEGLCKFSSDLQNWIMLLIYMLASSVFVSWQQLITIIVRPIIDEVEAGWLSFAVQTFGILSGPVVSATSDLWIETYPKLISIVFITLGAVSTGLFCLAAFVMTSFFTKWFVWIVLVFSGIAITSCQPVWWEMACDAAYPVAESVVSGTFSLANCVASGIFLTLFMFPQLGQDWATWSLFASEVACIPLLFIYKPSNKRRQCDRIEGRVDMEMNDATVHSTPL